MRCPNAVSRQIFRDRPGENPCSNESCLDHRVRINTLDALTGGRGKLVVFVLAFALISTLCIALFVNRDKTREILGSLDDRLESLSQEVSRLQAFKDRSIETGSGDEAFDRLQSDVEALETETGAAIEAARSEDVTRLGHKVRQLVGTVEAQSNKEEPRDTVNIVFADESAAVLSKLTELKQEADSHLEASTSWKQQAVAAYEDFGARLDTAIAQAKTLPSVPDEIDADLPSSRTRELARLRVRLDKIAGDIAAFVPADARPFDADEADLVVAATGDLAGELVAPILAEYLQCEPETSSDGVFYFTAHDGKNVILETTAPSAGYEKLANANCDLLISNIDPTASDLEKFGPDFQANRSVAEVIALDALTFLSHPENRIDVLHPSVSPIQSASVGAEDDEVRSIANRFGLDFTTSPTGSGEQIALLHRDKVSLSLFHDEAPNIRAKRLAVKASEDSAPLLPSPFTVATEDYRYSFRIIAWNRHPADPEALNFVRYCTSEQGQSVVADKGFVDLRLQAKKEDIPPQILAALGEAIGSDAISSAMRISTNLRFSTGESSLDFKAQADLERLPQYLYDAFPSHEVVVLGFTDSAGGAGINQPLSVARAEAAAMELRRSNVKASAAGLGSSFPVDSNDTEEGMARNRRVEVWVATP